MVTLWSGQLVAQTLLGKSAVGGALLLIWFLGALPVAAVLGGLLVRRIGERWTVVAGMAVSTAGYLLIAAWPVDLSHATTQMATDLVVAGLGLGLVIAPVSSVVLRLVPSAQHGVASSAVVVARMMGMLLGVAALSAWGFHRFQSLTRNLPTPNPFGKQAAKEMSAYKSAVKLALHTEYREFFLILAVLCGLAVLLGVALTRDRSRAEPPAQTPHPSVLSSAQADSHARRRAERRSRRYLAAAAGAWVDGWIGRYRFSRSSAIRASHSVLSRRIRRLSCGCNSAASFTSRSADSAQEVSVAEFGSGRPTSRPISSVHSSAAIPIRSTTVW
jgi:MFS family permease